MNIGDVSAFLRRLGILYYVDYVRFYIEKIRNKRKNQAFLNQNPNVAIPPDYLIYESFNLNYEKYYKDGYDTAVWLTDHFSKYKKLESLNILDWGCGPGRTIRHLPTAIGNNCSFFGTDYNKKSIEWCRENIPGVRFELNKIDPPTIFESEFFDIIYGISIFTHLSETSHYAWINELLRISKPGGILLLTTHGDAVISKLSKEEHDKYLNNELIIRDKVKEGHRVFGAFHPPQWARQFFEKHALILEYIPGKVVGDGGRPEQDVWILQKNKS